MRDVDILKLGKLLWGKHFGGSKNHVTSIVNHDLETSCFRKNLLITTSARAALFALLS